MNPAVLRSKSDFDFAIEAYSGAREIACDTETSGLNPKNAELFSVQFSDGDFSCLVPFSEGTDLGELSKILLDKKVTKIFHNARFDLGFLRASGYAVLNVFDTMIAEKVLTKGGDQSASLADTLYRYFAVDLDKDQRKKFGRSWDRVWSPELIEYALTDVVYLPELMRRQTKWLDDLDLSDHYHAHMLRVLEP